MKIYSSSIFKQYPRIFLGEDGKFYKDTIIDIVEIKNSDFLKSIPLTALHDWQEVIEQNKESLSISQTETLKKLKKLTGGVKK